MENMENLHSLNIILEKSTSILDSMKIQSKDERPKTIDKLKNVLGKTTDICYVSSVLNVIFKHGKSAEILISDIHEVKKSDKELDKEIASIAFGWADAHRRKVLVLPCDSNLHIEVASNIEEWYNNKKERYNADKPFEEIAKASCKEHDLDAEEIAEELSKHGYLYLDNNRVNISLPSRDVQLELENAFNRFQTRISESLEVLSARGQEFFSRELIEANKVLLDNSADKIKRYCEQQYSLKYSLYRKTDNGNAIGGVIQKLKGTSVDSSADWESIGDNMETEDTEEMDTLPDGKVETIQINLTCEAAHVLIQLFKTPNKPVTTSEFQQFVQSRCGVIYVISPKYILSNIIKESQELPRNFEFHILLGETITKKPLKLGDLNELAKAITFPGKDNVQKSSLIQRRAVRYRFEPMETDTALDSRRNFFAGFQRYVSESVKSKAERHRCVPIMMDRDAELRCRDRFLNWVSETNSNLDKRITPSTFTKELIELSYEFSKMPVEDLIQLLINCGYMETKANGSLEYKSHYRRPVTQTPMHDTTKFLKYWEEDYKPADKDNLEVQDMFSSRKRRLGGLQTDINAKKQRIVDI